VKDPTPEGHALLDVLLSETGLPYDVVHRELQTLLLGHNIDPATVTVRDLRRILTSYLQDVLIEAKEDLEFPKRC